MPPSLDVYARLERRDQEVLSSFLGDFMRGWEQDDGWLDEEQVSEAFARAFNDPALSLTRYGRSTTSGISTIIVAFGRDESMILGLSIEGEDEDQADAHAPDLMEELADKVGATMALAVWEEPPPLDRRDWDQALATLGERLVASRP